MQHIYIQHPRNKEIKRCFSLRVLIRTLFFVTASITLLGCAATSTYRWTEFTEKNFPAKVSQIITVYGNLLDQKHRAGYGEWDVRANADPPMATYDCISGEACQIVVSRLHCTNYRHEKTECAIRLNRDRHVCKLWLFDRQQSLSIRCPLDVVLVREKPDPSRTAETSTSIHRRLVRF